MLKSVYAGVTITISAVYFVLSLEAVVQFIRVRSGLTSWAALMSILVLGIGELSFVLLTGEMFRKLSGITVVTKKFLTLLAVFGWLYAVLQIFGIWTYIPNPANWYAYAKSLWSAGEFITFFSGIVIGVGIPIYLRISARRQKAD